MENDRPAAMLPRPTRQRPASSSLKRLRRYDSAGAGGVRITAFCYISLGALQKIGMLAP